MAVSCETCGHGIMCPTWGEYKCLKKKEWVSGEACEDYKATSNDKEKPKCNCNACSERVKIEDDD